jgi:hypothetical protein
VRCGVSRRIVCGHAVDGVETYMASVQASSCLEILERSAIWPSCFTSPAGENEGNTDVSGEVREWWREGGRVVRTTLKHALHPNRPGFSPPSLTVVLPRRVDEQDALGRVRLWGQGH